MSILIYLIVCKSNAHSIPTHTTPILENLVFHINVRRSLKPYPIIEADAVWRQGFRSRMK